MDCCVTNSIIPVNYKSILYFIARKNRIAKLRLNIKKGFLFSSAVINAVGFHVMFSEH